MKIRTFAVVSAVMYFVAAISVLCLLGTDFILVGLTHTQKFITAFLIFFFALLGTYIRSIGSADWYSRKILRRTIAILCFIYILIVVDFTLLDDSFGRSISSIFSLNKAELSKHLRENVNLIPLATVRLFIKGYNEGIITFGALLENLLGNLCVFMPFALFIPMLIPKLNSVWGVFLTTTLTVVMIEILQFVFLTGAMDIDDLILNILGAMLLYLVAKTKTVSRLLCRITFGVWAYGE